MTEQRILFVDDEKNLLDGLRRQLRGRYQVEFAVGGEEGLACIANKGSFAVVVSDMRMPGLSGVQFLREVKNLSPDTVRLMLTGNNDQDTAIQAVNQGNIFRFLTKPCEVSDLSKALDDALDQNRLITAERDLLQNTLTGSVKMLTDVLGASDPVSFSEALRVREFMKKFAFVLGLQTTWDLELAAMLSNIGFITVPQDVAKKFRTGKPLLKEEEDAISKVPEVGRELIMNIPRLENIAQIIRYHQKRFDGVGTPNDEKSGEVIPLGARILKITKDFLLLEGAGNKRIVALQKMQGRSGWYDPRLLNLFKEMLAGEEEIAAVSEEEVFEVRPDELCPGQMLCGDIETKDGRLLLTKRSRLTMMNVLRLANYERLVGLKRPLLVDCRIPARGR